MKPSLCVRAFAIEHISNEMQRLHRIQVALIKINSCFTSFCLHLAVGVVVGYGIVVGGFDIRLGFLIHRWLSALKSISMDMLLKQLNSRCPCSLSLARPICSFSFCPLSLPHSMAGWYKWNTVKRKEKDTINHTVFRSNGIIWSRVRL